MESTFGERLSLERQRLGLTQEALGKLGGMSRLAQFKYEHGEHMPSVEYLEKLFDNNVDAIFLLTGRRLAHDQIDWDIAREAYVFIHRNYVEKGGKARSPEKLFELFRKLSQTTMEETYGPSIADGEAAINTHVK